MNRLFIYLSLVAVLLVSGCSTVQQKRANVQAQAAYAISDSLKAGRVDLAKKYSEELVRLSPPPKKKIEIKAVKITKPDESGINKTVTLTVLPQEYQGQQTMTLGSAESNKLIAENPAIAEQLKKDDKNVETFKTKTEDTLRALDKELTKEKKSSFWGWLWASIGGIGIFGVIIICVLFPAAIPIVINIFTSIIGGINRGITSLGSYFKRSPPS